VNRPARPGGALLRLPNGRRTLSILGQRKAQLPGITWNHLSPEKVSAIPALAANAAGRI
jgi:hypothetical protein